MNEDQLLPEQMFQQSSVFRVRQRLNDQYIFVYKQMVNQKCFNHKHDNPGSSEVSG